MNCAECRDNLVACAEGLLDPGQLSQCRAHLETCAACRAELEAITSLQQKLTARGQAAASISLVQPVMRRVREVSVEHERPSLMSRIFSRWGFGLGAAAGAAIVITAIVVLTSPRAFGIEQVIEAYNHIRSLHVKVFPAKSQEPREFWIKTNERGEVERARYYLPETEDGPKLITWKPEGTELWFKGKHGYVTLQTKKIQPWMESLLHQGQPQWVLKQLLESQKKGEVVVAIQNPINQEPGAIVVTHRNEPKKDVYRIDSKTDLISRIERYRIEGTSEILESRTEFSEYNVPIEEKMFSIREELPKDVQIADRLNQIAGVAQGNLTDEQAAAETVRQFFQALVDKDYKKAGLIEGGLLEEFARKEFGTINATRIVSVDRPIPQPDWDKHGFKVPCAVEVVQPNGQVTVWKSEVYVRPGDDEMHPDHWQITGGINPTEAAATLPPDNDRYARMTPKEAAEAFFKACAERNWDEALMWCAPDLLDRMKQGLGGLELISLGEPFQSGRYPGWYVPYEIKMQPYEIYVRLANTNRAGRYVVTGMFDSDLKLRQDIRWTNEPPVLPENDTYARLTPVEAAAAYFRAASVMDWAEMRKFAPDYDVDNDMKQIAEAEKAGLDIRKLLPATEVIEEVASQDPSSHVVKCRVSRVRKWNIALKKSPTTGRWYFDGGL